MSDPNVTPIDDLLWTSTRFSDVLRLDRRMVAQALETAPFQTRNGHRVWHLRDGMPAIFQRVGGGSSSNDPETMEPKTALDWYRGQREKLKLAVETNDLIPAADIERTVGIAFKTLAHSLDSLPDALERDLGLPPALVAAIQQAVDSARETLHRNLTNALPQEAPQA
jgi:hypothetical protein